ncbi:hypothetical protein C0Q70_04147 [Pomacea canaliculata]|uniref:Ig-like domain-containing protein n=1 Tax=Pomacea canaliculata TaxID=400727 RepID=A0A2T7PUQ2_POMCA|nr:hypothetical protein C0Q70_04147 [Pomacea canaliculata]
MLTPQLDSRYNVVDGRLSIQNPQEEKDAGAYYCTAVNDFGTVRTHSVRISFGCNARKPFQGTAINCNPPRYNPGELSSLGIFHRHYLCSSNSGNFFLPSLLFTDASFQWFKGPGLNFVRPHLNLHQFVSYNGRLYFSETQRSDAGMYYCVVTLTTPRGQRAATVQPPSRTSLGIELLIRGDSELNFDTTDAHRYMV